MEALAGRERFSRVKILQLIHGLNTGGAETLVKEYALRLDREAFDVTVLCYEHCDSPYEGMLRDAGIPVIYVCDDLAFNGRKSCFVKLIHHFARYVLVKRYIKKINPDILHLHLQLSGYVRYAKPDRKTKLFYTQHSQIERWKENYPKEIRHMAWLLRNYDTQLIALTEPMRRELNALFHRTDTVILNNGIPLDQYGGSGGKFEMKRRCGIPEQSFVVGHVGRFDTVKNHEFLLRVFDEIQKRERNAWLLLIGSGPLEASIKKRLVELGLQNRAVLLRNRMDICDLLHAMDVFVFPSFSEGLPLSVIEAQAACVPCLVSTGTPARAGISNHIAYLPLSEPPEKWAEQALRATKSGEPWSYDHIEDWDIRTIIKKLEAYYLEKAGNRGGGDENREQDR